MKRRYFARFLDTRGNSGGGGDRRRYAVRLVAALAGVAAYCWLADRFFGYVCPSEILIGLPCPGCGLTRAAVLLAKGDVGGSLAMNPSLMLIPPYAALAVMKKRNAASNYMVVAALASFVVFGWRLAHSFGVEPLVFNPNCAAMPIWRMLIQNSRQ